MITAIVQARMNASRLPGKVMLDLGGMPILWRVVERVRLARLVGEVVVATSYSRCDDIIESSCVEWGVRVFRGDESNVLDRFLQCAVECDVTDIMRITADCPLHDPKVMDLVARKYLGGGFDYVSNTIEYTFPDGFDVEVFSLDALDVAWGFSESAYEREHVTPYLRESGRFKTFNVRSTRDYPLYRCTLDCHEDYQVIVRIYEALKEGAFHVGDVVEYLNKHPEIVEINDRFNVLKDG